MTVAVGRVRLQRWLELSRSESRVDGSEILGSRANQQRLLNQLVLFELIGFLHFFLSRFSLSLSFLPSRSQCLSQSTSARRTTTSTSSSGLPPRESRNSSQTFSLLSVRQAEDSPGEKSH